MIEPCTVLYMRLAKHKLFLQLRQFYNRSVIHVGTINFRIWNTTSTIDELVQGFISDAIDFSSGNFSLARLAYNTYSAILHLFNFLADLGSYFLDRPHFRFSTVVLRNYFQLSFVDAIILQFWLRTQNES